MAENNSTDSGVALNTEDLSESLKRAGRTIGISLATESDLKEYWIWYQGKENLTFVETLLMWGYLTDWVVGQARELEESQGAVEAAKHAIRTFAKKVKELGEEEWERLEAKED